MATAEPPIQAELLDELGKIPPEYLPALLKMMRAFREGVTLGDARQSFRQGWLEATSGKIRPIDELWEGIDAE